MNGPRRTSGFTQIDNESVRDKKISLRARGLLAFLLSHDGTRAIEVQWVAKDTGEKEHTIRRAMTELEAEGYLTGHQRQNGPGGQILWTPWVIHETPWSSPSDKTPGMVATMDGEHHRRSAPSMASPSDGEPFNGVTIHGEMSLLVEEHLPVEEHPVEDLTAPKRRRAARVPDAEFDRFRSAYRAAFSPLVDDNRKLGQPNEAWLAWQKLTADERALAFEGVERQGKSARPGDAVCHASTWLNQQRWLNDDLKQKPTGGDREHANPFEDY